MANRKITELTEKVNPVGTDQIEIVSDPSGSPASRKASIENAVQGAAVSISAGVSDAGKTVKLDAAGKIDTSMYDTVTASNQGSEGIGVFKQKTGEDLEFYKISNDDGVIDVSLNGSDKVDVNISNFADLDEKVSVEDDDLMLLLDSSAGFQVKKARHANIDSGSSGGAGETNTMSNVGINGVGVFKQKNGVNFEMKNVSAASNKVTVTDNVVNDVVSIDIDEENISTSALNNDAGFISSVPVDSVFGRTGVIAADTGDYDASQIDNDSGVSGATVANALDNLEANQGETNTASNVGTGEGVFKQKTGSNFEIKSITGGTDISVTGNTDDVQISFTGIVGESNTTSNLGSGEGLGAPKVGVNLPIKSLVGGTNVSLSSDTNTVTINATGTGETNTASNIGSAGVGVFDGKVLEELQFKKINNASSKLSVTDNAVNSTVDIDVVDANIDHNSLDNYVANEHVNHTNVSISGGVGISGGGDITANRTLDLDINGLTEETTVDEANDFVALYDASAGTIVKVKPENIPSGAAAFQDLTDTPANYTSQALKLLRVKSAEDGIEFVDVPSAQNISYLKATKNSTPQTLTSTISDVVGWDADNADSPFTFNSTTGVLEFNQDGLYEITYDIQVSIVGTNRVNLVISVEENIGGGGFVSNDELVWQSYGPRNTPVDLGGTIGSYVKEYSAGDQIKFRAQSLDEDSQVSQDEGRIYVKLMQTGGVFGGGSGEINTASNVGAGEGVFSQKSGVNLEFKSLVAGTNITLTNNPDNITIDAAAGSGEANTASNQGAAGVGVFIQKSLLDLEFKNINSGSSKISVTDDVANNEIDIDVVEANINASAINNDAGFITASSTDTLTNKTLTSPVINVTSDAEGDVYYRNAGGNFTRLPIGTAGQVLQVNAGATAPEWTTASSGGLNWGDSITDTSGTGITATLGASSAVNTTGLQLNIDDTQSNNVFGQQIDVGTSNSSNVVALRITEGASQFLDIGRNITRDNLSQGVNFSFSYSGSLTNRNAVNNVFNNSRNNTATSGTVTDNYDLASFKRTSIQNGVGGTLSSSGSVVKIENVATQTAGTLTDTTNTLEIVQDADSTGNPIDITQNAVISTNFKKYLDLDSTGLFKSDGTTPDTNLTGTAGDFLINGDTSKPYYCTGGTSWEAVASETYVDQNDTKTVIIKVAGTLATGDGAERFTIPDEINGFNLISVGAHVYTASTSGLVNIQIHNETDTVDILSTSITIDANENDSSTAVTPPVINTANDDVVLADVIRIDIDGVGTGSSDLEVRLQFQKP